MTKKDEMPNLSNNFRIVFDLWLTAPSCWNTAAACCSRYCSKCNVSKSSYMAEFMFFKGLQCSIPSTFLVTFTSATGPVREIHPQNITDSRQFGAVTWKKKTMLSINQSTNQPINQSTNQTITHSLTQSINQSITYLKMLVVSRPILDEINLRHAFSVHKTLTSSEINQLSKSHGLTINPLRTFSHQSTRVALWRWVRLFRTAVVFRISMSFTHDSSYSDSLPQFPYPEEHSKCPSPSNLHTCSQALTHKADNCRSLSASVSVFRAVQKGSQVMPLYRLSSCPPQVRLFPNRSPIKLHDFFSTCLSLSIIDPLTVSIWRHLWVNKWIILHRTVQCVWSCGICHTQFLHWETMLCGVFVYQWVHYSRLSQIWTVTWRYFWRTNEVLNTRWNCVVSVVFRAGNVYRVSGDLARLCSFGTFSLAHTPQIYHIPRWNSNQIWWR